VDFASRLDEHGPMLVSLLKSDAVPFAKLHDRYGSLLELVRTLIGVVPNCDPYLEIWPPAFRTYNVMVPNFLNLPFLVWGMGGAPRDVLGLAMYASSRTAGCAYCSAHTCSFALRRGTAPDKVARALSDDASRTPAEEAAIAIARALSRVPSDVTSAQRRDLEAHFSRAGAEWIALAVAMMGFLNKFMDALGVELEGSTVEETRGLMSASGWSPGQHGDGGASADGAPPRPDGLMTKLGVLRYAPSAIALDKKWTAGVPDRWPAVGEYLRAQTGHDFPVLSKLTHRRPIRALATMLRDNLDPKTSTIGVARKLAAGVVFARAVGNAALGRELEALGAPEQDARVEALARAISPSPALVDDAVLAQCRDLGAAAIVEVVTFVSVLQLVHRVESFHAA
jgi:alkylhydroperoxidase family enzyme